MKVTIKHFNNEEEKKVAQSLGLQEFNSLAFQHKMIPEGIYDIETKHMFGNQYNTKGKDGHNGYRVFEYNEILSQPSARRLGRGYYISEGIEAIRALQKDIKACGYCGAQYHKTAQEWCDKCLGSEYLTEDNYKLLKLVYILEKDHHKYNDKMPVKIKKTIKLEQKKTRLRILEKRRVAKLKDLKQGIATAKKEYEAFKWLIDHYVNFDNVIYYAHTDEFSFGWRTPLTTEEKKELPNTLKDFPYNYTFK